MSNILIKTFYKHRDEFNRMTEAHVKKLAFPSNVEEYPDVVYSGDSPNIQTMDIFRPKNRQDEFLPVIVNVHGGGLLLGNKDFNRHYCALLSSMGYVVFSIEFRLIPEIQVYEQFSDVSQAMDSVKMLIPQYHGDPEHVYVVGDSGGAYLIIYTIAMQQSKALADAANVTPSDLNVNALGLISGMFYTTRLDQVGLFLPPYLYGKNYKKSAFAPYTNPEHPDIITALPPCFLVTSHNDNLQRYTLHFEKALTRYNIPHELKNYPRNKKLTHAFSIFDPFAKESLDSTNAMIQFFRKY